VASSNKTFPVPVWVRAVVCLAPFVIAAFVVFDTLTEDRGLWPMYLALAPCTLVISLVLAKR
jgi:hypothetical protein